MPISASSLAMLWSAIFLDLLEHPFSEKLAGLVSGAAPFCPAPVPMPA